jgi:hypothetical protein
MKELTPTNNGSSLESLVEPTVNIRLSRVLQAMSLSTMDRNKRSSSDSDHVGLNSGLNREQKVSKILFYVLAFLTVIQPTVAVNILMKLMFINVF